MLGIKVFAYLAELTTRPHGRGWDFITSTHIAPPSDGRKPRVGDELTCDGVDVGIHSVDAATCLQDSRLLQRHTHIISK